MSSQKRAILAQVLMGEPYEVAAGYPIKTAEAAAGVTVVVKVG